jgi:hypothetical protein
MEIFLRSLEIIIFIGIIFLLQPILYFVGKYFRKIFGTKEVETGTNKYIRRNVNIGYLIFFFLIILYIVIKNFL